MQAFNQRQGTVAWLAAFGSGLVWPQAMPCQRDDQPPSRQALSLLQTSDGWSPSVAQRERYQVIFDGLLYNRAELLGHFAAHLPGDPSDADLVGQAYCRWGKDAIGRVKGIFALILWDSTCERLLCARDPLGMHPLFYTQLENRLLLSPSIETLLAYPGVSAELNRVCLVAHLLAHRLVRHETYFTAISRVLPGHLMQVDAGGRHVQRYWDPLPMDQPFEWLPDGEVQAGFEALLEQVVARYLTCGPASIYLSGGVDSSMLAMVITTLCQRQGKAMPVGLSLMFAEPTSAEAVTQARLATELALEHLQLPFDEAAGPEGTLAAALEMSRTLPAPLWLIWGPALRRLALYGQQQGCTMILTGDGADEWLWQNPILAADFLRSLDLHGLYRLWRSYDQSYHFSRAEVLRLLWRAGARPWLQDIGEAAAMKLGAYGSGRQPWRIATQIAAIPPWLMPDAALRAQIMPRLQEQASNDSPRQATTRRLRYYLHDTRARLDSSDKWRLEEETFLLGKRLGMPVRKPFWDPDLIAFLVRVRPHVRSTGGFAKALVRGPLVRRFPHLGFQTQRKSFLGSTVIAVIAAQGERLRQAMGGIQSLGELGVVDRARTNAFLDEIAAGQRSRWWLMWVWQLLNLEAWVRAHR